MELLALSIFVSAVIVGISLVYFKRKGNDKDAAMSDRLSEQLRANADELSRQVASLQIQHSQQLETIKLQKDQEIASIRDRHQQQLDELRKENRENMEAMRRDSEAQFKAMATEIAKSNTEFLKKSNSEQIESLLRPLSENIAGFRKAVTDTYVAENASRKSLADQIDRLMKLNESIGAEARNLTSALKGNSKVQGDWGEMVLETMLERAGLERDIHYVVQATKDSSGETLRDENGRLQRPDVVVIMPDSRKLIIDSKVSLTAFVDYCNCEDSEEKAKHLRDHVMSVKRHIDELGAKSYHANLKDSADYVMMFVPNEGAYIVAVQADPELWKYAYERHVAIVSPTHLFSVMRIVSQLWVQDKQNRNTIKIAAKGGALYDKVVLYVSAMQDLGDALAKASTHYDTAMSRLATGKGNILKTADDLRLLGAKTAKTFPTKIKEMIDEDDEMPDSLPAE